MEGRLHSAGMAFSPHYQAEPDQGGAQQSEGSRLRHLLLDQATILDAENGTAALVSLDAQLVMAGL